MVRQNRRILLLVDNGPWHHHPPDEYPNARIESLAPKLTARIRPMDAGDILCFEAQYRSEFTQLALQRDNEGVEKICHIDRFAAADTNTQALKGEEAAHRQADALSSEAEAHPRMMKLDFQQMMAVLIISHPTERELTEEEIAGEVLVSFEK
ncbi:tigger transposable element-derived protein 4 [Ceratobasidium sp. AG-Ba]|nr:tigger transposable element-derived protein 4 [Ceratobasidium sp. AG-Ba]